jgi:chemotaxis regulatin CheY-phosphate phosphatase CheZ
MLNDITQAKTVNDRVKDAEAIAKQLSDWVETPVGGNAVKEALDQARQYSSKAEEKTAVSAKTLDKTFTK